MMSYFSQRRKKILATIPEDAVIVIATNPLQVRSNDTSYKFRPNSNFYYFTSFTEPLAVMVLSHSEYIIFLQAKDKKSEMWDGARLGLVAGAKQLEAKTKNITQIKTELPKILDKYNKVYVDFENIQLDLLGVSINKPQYSIKENVTKLRLIKDKLELKYIKKACGISIKAQQKLMSQIKELSTEYQAQAILDYQFSFNNTEHAYSPIVAAGNNANTLHYINNNDSLDKNKLILIDAGCEFNYYASDITRTYPIGGKFNKAQQQIYNIVLSTQQEIIAQIKPGITLKQLNELAINSIAKGLIKLGIVKSKKAITKFYPHSIGHFLGLDVHDLGSKNQELQPNMVITVEPGIYLPNNAKIDKKYQGIGIRIEDDVLITKNGCEVLTAECPKNIEQLERIIN